jgi:hypothetical protein
MAKPLRMETPVKAMPSQFYVPGPLPGQNFSVKKEKNI